MARRKDHTREELTELAIQSGQELVIAEGLGALTARNVAKLMGYTPGTLYNIFENLDELASEINARTLRSFAATIQLVLRNTAKPKKRMQAICAAYLQLQDDNPHLWSLCFATPLKNPTDNYHEAVHQAFDSVVEALRPFNKSKTAARQDAKIVWAALHGICLLRQSGELNVTEVDPSEELAKRFLNQFLNR